MTSKTAEELAKDFADSIDADYQNAGHNVSEDCMRALADGVTAGYRAGQEAVAHAIVEIIMEDNTPLGTVHKIAGACDKLIGREPIAATEPPTDLKEK